MNTLKTVGMPETEPAAVDERQPASVEALLEASELSGLATARLLERTDEGWRVMIRGQQRSLPVDAAVDPALLVAAHQRGARVLCESGCIIGVVQTERALTIDRHDAIDAQVDRLRLQVRREAVIQDAKAFIAIKSGDVELYGRRVLTRAREVAKVLARMISLN
jgi:hypothetical protein